MDGSVTLTAVRLLAPHLTVENHEALLREATHKRTEQVKELVARISPRSDVASSIRKLPATVAPLAADRYEFRFTAPASTRDKLRHARDLLRHALPGGDTGEIVDRALTVLIESLERKKFAATEKPRASRATAPHSRHIPANVRRTVWGRDGGRCAFVADDGRRCDARSPLEFHHRSPHAATGPATVENIALRCKAHNRYEAAVYFGPIWTARGEGRVEEIGERYGMSVRPSTRFKTSCVSDTQ